MATSATHILPERYRDTERIARGAMGDIFRATDVTLDRVVAIKLLAHQADGEESRRRFAREARAAARVSDDPHIVTIYDVGDSAECPFIVMEYVDGSSLAERLRANGRPAPADALRWLEQAAHALDHAHANGVVHRDVKPGNLLLDRDDNVRVADFGIASAAWLPSLTTEGTVLGTAGYLAPEQALGQRTGAASDRYALGIVAYELLTGERPFARDSPTAEAAAHVNEPVPSIADRRSDLPAGLDAVFRRALAKRPEDRYATCAELVEALRAALETAAGDTRVYAATPAAPARRHDRAPRWPFLAAGLGAALVVAVVLAVALSGTSSAPRTTSTASRTHTTAPRTADPHALNDRAWSLMQQGRYADALPLLVRAVRGLRGAGPADPAEGFANYNLGYTLLQLGSCSDAQPYLERAKTLEPDRVEVDSALNAVRQCLNPAAAPKQHGKPKKGPHKKGD